MAELKVVGFDPSLRHWGIASGVLDLTTQSLEINYVDVLEPAYDTGKKVRQNSKDLQSAEQLCTGAWAAIKGADALFVEVPHGSQSSRSMASYGICVGVLGALRTSGVPFYELTEREVKLGTLGKTKATKAEMIEWATEKWPSAPWSTHKKNGEIKLTESKVEHQADAVATIHAGIQHPTFQQVLALAQTKLRNIS